MGPSAGSDSGSTDPSTRSSGGAPVVMCMSLAPLSIMTFRSCCRFTRGASAPWSITPRYGAYPLKLESGSVAHRNAEDFFGAGHAVEDFADAACAQGQHPLLDGGGL